MSDIEQGVGGLSYKARRIFSGGGEPFVEGLHLIVGDIYINDANGDHYEFNGTTWDLKFGTAVSPLGELTAILTVVPPFGEIQFPGFAGDSVIGVNGDGAVVASLMSLTKLNTLAGVKVYRALLTQANGEAPVAAVLQNSLGGTVVWSRSNEGVYEATLTGAFPTSKTFIITQRPSNSFVLAARRSSDNVVILESLNNVFTSDDLLNSHSLEILVYP